MPISTPLFPFPTKVQERSETINTPPLMQKRLSKYSRSKETFKAVAHRQITDRSLDIISYLYHYRILPTSLLVRLVPGSQGNTRRHLQTLFHKYLINFFVFPKLRNVSEHHFYLDNPQALNLLVERGWASREDLDYKRVRYKRDRKYQAAHAEPDDPERQAFMKHEVNISRFHFLLEMACRQSGGEIELYDWRQGPEIWKKVMAPKVRFDGQRDLWGEDQQLEPLPHRPDAFFTLRFPHRPEAKQFESFLYEHDRKTTTDRKRITKKLRAHFQYIIKNHQYRTDYGVNSIKAVIIETTDDKFAMQFREAARHPLVSPHQPSQIFWFTTSRLFETGLTAESAAQHADRKDFFLLNPTIVFHNIWSTAVDQNLRSLIE